MAKVDLSSKSVAYFDKGVDEAGFYIVEKEAADNDGEVKIGKQVFPSPDGEGFQTTQEGDD